VKNQALASIIPQYGITLLEILKQISEQR